jgi:hypothetical protein
MGIRLVYSYLGVPSLAVHEQNEAHHRAYHDLVIDRLNVQIS